MLTLLQMIDYALNQAQLDSSFRPDARLWYNITANRLANKYDYPFYYTKVDTIFVPGTKDYSVPANFNRAETCYQIDNQGNQGVLIPILEPYLFNQMNGGNISGPSSVAMIDQLTAQIKFNTSLSDNNNSVGFRLFYYRKPVQVDLTGTSDSSVPDFLDQDTMMEELKKNAFEFRDDPRYMQKKMEAKEALVEYQRNQYNNDSYSTVPLNAVNFRSTNRRSRSRGFRS